MAQLGRKSSLSVIDVAHDRSKQRRNSVQTEMLPEGKQHQWMRTAVSSIRYVARWCRKALTGSTKPRKKVTSRPILIKNEDRLLGIKQRTKRVHFRLPKPRTAKVLQPFDHDSPWLQKWTYAMVLPLAYEIWAFPFRLAFGVASFNGIMQTDLIVDFAFLCDAIVKCSTKIPAGTLPDQDTAIVTFKGITRMYFKRQFLWDVLPSALYYAFTALHEAIHIRQGVVLWLWWLSTTPRMLVRTTRLMRYFRDMSMDLKINVRLLETVKFMMVILLSSHCFGCVMFWLSRLLEHNSSTWVADFDNVLPRFDHQEDGLESVYLICLYKGFNLISGLAYDYGMPKNPLEILWRMVTMVFQVYMSALILGSLLNYIVRNSPEEVAYKQRMDDLVAYVEANRIPQELAEGMYKHIEFQHKRTAKRTLQNQSDIPKSLLVKATRHQYKAIIGKSTCKGTPFFGCSEAFLDELLVNLQTLHLHPGEQVAKKDDIAWQLCFVVDGAVSLMDDENRIVRVIRSDVPDMAPIAGAVPFFIGMFHMYSIRARPDGEVQLLVLAKAESERLFGKFPAELQRIRENILASYGLGLDGQDLSGGQGEEGTDWTEVKGMIQSAIQDHTYRRYAEFFSAVENGNVEVVSHILSRGMEVNTTNCDGRTALHIAAIRGHHKVMELLLEQGASINEKDMWQHTPYWAAVCKKQDLSVSLLKQCSANLDVPHPEEVLWDAACSGDLETVRMLVENKVDPNIRTFDLRAALHVCAAEGHEHIVDYLLRNGADINARDRFEGTPLKDAVLAGHNLLASILRSKGALLPDGMGADLLCTASSEGNIPLLQLLFECHVDLNIGDYDRRCALHLAAAEAKVLAVSFLLSHTADPNVEDRWGGRPLDDALTGGTLYHMFCAKLIRSWGGQVGTFDTTSEEGRERLEQLDAMNIKDAFNLVKKLLELGFGREKVSRVSEEDIAVGFESTMAVIPVVADLRNIAEALCATVRHRKSVLSKTLGVLNDVIENMPKLSDIRGSPSKSRAESRSESPDLPPTSPFASISALSLSQQASFSSNKDSSADEDEIDEDEAAEPEELDGTLYDPLNALEPDEEEVLQKEVDKMSILLGRAQDAHLTAQGLAALAFHKASAQILMISESLQSLIQAFVDFRTETLRKRNLLPSSTAGEEDTKESNVRSAKGRDSPAGSFRRSTSGILHHDPELDFALVSEENLEQVLSWMTANNLQEEVEDMLEEAHNFLALEAKKSGHRGPMPEADPGDATTFRSARNLNATAGSGEQEEDVNTVPVEAILAGSSSFRRTCQNLPIDSHLCRILESQLREIFSEDECRQLVAIEAIDVNPGTFALNEDGQESERWFIILEGIVSVTDEDHRMRNRDMFSGTGMARRERHFQAGHALGAWQVLTGTDPNTSVTVLEKSVFLQFQIEPLLLLVKQRPNIQATLANMMAEAPGPTNPATVDSANIGKGLRLLALQGGSEQSQGGAAARGRSGAFGNLSNLLQVRRDSSAAPDAAKAKIGELKRKAIKDAMLVLDDLWACLSLGHSFVAIGQLHYVGTKLGEAGKETFSKLFAEELDPENMAVGISETDFWQCWLRFAAEDEEEKGEEGEGELTSAEGNLDNQDMDAESTADGDKETLLDQLHGLVSSARSLKPRFFDPSVLDTYEVSFEQVAGDLSKSLPRKKIVEYLNQVFVDFPYQISAHNVREFFREFSAQGNHATSISWTEIRHVLREHRMGIVFNEGQLFVGTALNPRSAFHGAWRSLIRLCAFYHVIMVPVRAAFLPWDSMTHTLALSTDLPVDLLVFLHLIVCANTAYKSSRSVWVSNRLKILRKVSFYVVLAALPLDWFAHNSGASNEVCCFWRLPKMLLYLSFPANVNSSQSSVRKKLTFMVKIVVFVLHVSSCIWFFLGRSYKSLYSPSISWYEVSPSLSSFTFTRDGLYGWADEDSTWDKYLVALFWVTSTFTVNGTVGDVIPQNLAEAAFSIILMILSMTLYQWTIGEVSGIIMNADSNLVKRREEYTSLSNYIEGNKLPDSIGSEILNNFDASQSSSTDMQRECFKCISHRLQVDVSRFLYKDTLENVMLFEGCSDSFIDSICNITRESTYVPEQVLYHEGEAATELFVVVSGQVDIVAKSERGEVMDSLLSEGQTAGEMATVFGINHIHSARAVKLQGASCLVMRREQFFDILQLFPEDEHLIASNALLAFERNSNSMKTDGNSSRMSASTGLTSNSRQSLEEEDEGNQGSESSAESGVNSSMVGADVGKKMQFTLQQLKARHSATLLHMFHRAAMQSDIERMQQLLSRMSDKAVNEPSDSQRTALHVAAVHGSVEAVKFLLEHAADPHAKDSHGNTPFNDAILHGQDDVAGLMRQLVPAIRLELDAARVATLLSQAAAQGKATEVKRLLENKAEVDASNADHRTALHVAACSGHEEVVGLLLESGAAAYARDKVGWTPLDGAVMCGLRGVQDLMNAKGVTLGAGRNMEMIVRMCTLASENDVDGIKNLVRNGADVTLGDYDMRTPIHLAASCGKLAVLDYLLSLDININPMDRFGGTPLDDAVRHGNKTVASALEERGALGKGDPKQAAMLEEQMRQLQEQMKEARAPVVAEEIEKSTELAMRRYLAEELSPLLQSLGEKLQETLRRVIRSLKSVSEAVARQERKMKRAATHLHAATKILGGGPVNLRQGLPELLNADGSGSPSDSPTANQAPSTPWRKLQSTVGEGRRSRAGSLPETTEEVYVRKGAADGRGTAGGVGGGSPPRANGHHLHAGAPGLGNGAANVGRESEIPGILSAEAMLERSLQNGWMEHAADPHIVEKLASPPQRPQPSPVRLGPPSAVDVDDTLLARAPRTDALHGSPDSMQVGRNDPVSGSAATTDSTGSVSGPAAPPALSLQVQTPGHRELTMEGTGPAPPQPPREVVAGASSGGDAEGGGRGAAGRGGGGQSPLQVSKTVEASLNQQQQPPPQGGHGHGHGPALLLSTRDDLVMDEFADAPAGGGGGGGGEAKAGDAAVLLPGSVQSGEQSEEDSPVGSEAPEPVDRRRRKSEVLLGHSPESLFAAVNQIQRENTQKRLAEEQALILTERVDSDASGAGVEEGRPYKHHVRFRWRLFMKREIELYDMDVDTDEVATEDIEEWFEFVLHDLTAMNKAIAALRLEIDAACNGVPQQLHSLGLTKGKSNTTGKIWKMVMSSAMSEMQILRGELGVCMTMYKSLRREVNSLAKGRARQRARAFKHGSKNARRLTIQGLGKKRGGQ